MSFIIIYAEIYVYTYTFHVFLSLSAKMCAYTNNSDVFFILWNPSVPINIKMVAIILSVSSAYQHFHVCL